MQKFCTLDDFEYSNQVVLVRADLNVPIIHGKITDYTRIKRSMATIKYLIERGAKVVVLSHFGRPKGKYALDMSLSPLTDALSKELNGMQVKFCVDIMSSFAGEQIASLLPGEVMLVENLRFHPEEEANDLAFAEYIAKFADYYVNDTFSCSHRAHASIEAITNFLPSAAGLLLTEELNNLAKYLETPSSPVMAMVGGSKVSTKIDLLTSLIDKVDRIFIAGAMANSFLRCQGYNVGKSSFEEEYLATAANILSKAKEADCRIILPSDVVTSAALDGEDCQVANLDDINPEHIIFDIGPQTITTLFNLLEQSKSVIWNGPLGAFEYKPFDVGTNVVGLHLSKLTRNRGVISVIGGGDVVAALTMAGLINNFTYSSTGGGAFLEWMEGKILPGVQALQKKLA